MVLMQHPDIHNIQPINIGLGLKTQEHSVLFIYPFQCILLLMRHRNWGPLGDEFL